jgi:hypothetical protein
MPTGCFLKASFERRISPYALFRGNRDMIEMFLGGYHQSTYSSLLRVTEKPSVARATASDQIIKT